VARVHIRSHLTWQSTSSVACCSGPALTPTPSTSQSKKILLNFDKTQIINRIHHSLEGDAIGTVDTGNSEKPRSLAVHPIKRLLFWTDVGSRQAVIRAKMDGSNSMVLAIQLEGVTSLAVDPISNMIFFAHGRKIEFMDINGKNR
jgi:hypothetical protein